jgi:molecular chaperone GrpE
MSETPVPPEDTDGPARSADTGPAGQAAPAGLGDQVADPADRIAGLRARIGELEDLRRRALADLDNVQKRCAAQITRVEAETSAAVAREWLPVIDNLDRALEHSSADPAAIIEGVRAVRDQALGVLGRLGFPRREDDQGAAFDPFRHDAVAARDAAGAADGSVVEVVRPGYGEGAHQLRPAQVVVARSD